jgi:hypothetical protein
MDSWMEKWWSGEMKASWKRRNLLLFNFFFSSLAGKPSYDSNWYVYRSFKKAKANTSMTALTARKYPTGWRYISN